MVVICLSYNNIYVYNHLNKELPLDSQRHEKRRQFLKIERIIHKFSVSLRESSTFPWPYSNINVIITGIVNCANVANGIVAACKEHPPKHPLVIRLEGTNAALARKILKESGLPLQIISDADEAAKAAVKLAQWFYFDLVLCIKCTGFFYIM